MPRGMACEREHDISLGWNVGTELSADSYHICTLADASILRLSKAGLDLDALQDRTRPQKISA